jgi:hypothetical protein
LVAEGVCGLEKEVRLIKPPAAATAKAGGKDGKRKREE